MPSFEVVIEPQEPKTPPKPSPRRKAAPAAPKTREFRAGLVGYVAAGEWWGGGNNSDNIRPVYATFVATEGAMRPFLAYGCVPRAGLPHRQAGSWCPPGRRPY